MKVSASEIKVGDTVRDGGFKRDLLIYSVEVERVQANGAKLLEFWGYDVSKGKGLAEDGNMFKGSISIKETTKITLKKRAV